VLNRTEKNFIYQEPRMEMWNGNAMKSLDHLRVFGT
jgi:hypothetical protein